MARIKSAAPVGFSQIKSVIAGLEWVVAEQLHANARNWRGHSVEQRVALAEIVEKVGFADALLAYRDSAGKLTLIDGHLRLEMTPPTEKLPVLVLDVDEDGADRLLASIDTVGNLAETRADRLGSLLEGIEARHQALSVTLHEEAEPTLDDLFSFDETVSETVADAEVDSAVEVPVLEEPLLREAPALSSGIATPEKTEKPATQKSTWGVLREVRADRDPMLRLGALATMIPRPLYDRLTHCLETVYAENHQAGVLEVLTLGLDAISG